MRKKTIFCLALFLSAFLPVSAQTTMVVAGEGRPDESMLRRQAFEKVWTTINEKHFDPTFGGVDWAGMREIYEPKAMAAGSTVEFHNILRQMLGELKLSHFGVYSREARMPVPPGGSGVIGVDLKMIDGRAVVSRVDQGSAAEKSGLRTGFSVSGIDGKTIGDLLAPLEKYLAERGESETGRIIYRERALLAYLSGKPETLVRLEVLDERDEIQAIELVRRPANNEISEAVGNFPPQEVLFEAKRLPGNIGYIRFNMWVIPQMSKIRGAVREFADARGIIFDLRGNPGGIGGMASGVAGLLVTRQTSLGTMKGRETELKFIVYPQPGAFAGKIVVLIDYGTASTSEIFAAGLQEIGRAVVVGERSAGAVLPSIFDILPTGAVFQYAVSDYKSPKNVLIEGRGVIPDVEVKQTRRALLEGRDLPLESAVKQILKEENR